MLFYTRHQCPLCEEAWERLQESLASSVGDMPIRRVNIDTDPALVQLYGWRIPVLRLDDAQEFDLAIPDQWEAAIGAIGRRL